MVGDLGANSHDVAIAALGALVVLAQLVSAAHNSRQHRHVRRDVAELRERQRAVAEYADELGNTAQIARVAYDRATAIRADDAGDESVSAASRRRIAERLERIAGELRADPAE